MTRTIDVLGLAALTVDELAFVSRYPEPDGKVAILKQLKAKTERDQTAFDLNPADGPCKAATGQPSIETNNRRPRADRPTSSSFRAARRGSLPSLRIGQ
jgi:hypothetical protein